MTYLQSTSWYCQQVYDWADKASTSLHYAGGPLDALHARVKDGALLDNVELSHLHRAVKQLRELANRIEGVYRAD